MPSRRDTTPGGPRPGRVARARGAVAVDALGSGRCGYARPAPAEASTSSVPSTAVRAARLEPPVEMSPLLKHRLMALAAPVCWSAAGVTVKLMEEAGAWQVTFYRSATVALFMLAVLGVRYGRNTWRAVRATGWYGPLAGVMVGMAMICNIYALNHTTVTSVTLLMASSPVFGAVLGWLVLREPVGPRTWAAVVLALAGGAVMVGGSVGTGGLRGDLMAVVAVLFFGIYSVTLRLGRDIDMTPAVLYAGVFAAAVGAAVAALGGEGFTATRADIARCVALGIFQLGLGSLLFAMAARVVSAVELTLFALGESILSPIWAWLVVAERPSASAVAGGAVILLAIVVQTVGGGRRAPGRDASS